MWQSLPRAIPRRVKGGLRACSRNVCSAVAVRGVEYELFASMGFEYRIARSLLEPNGDRAVRARKLRPPRTIGAHLVCKVAGAVAKAGVGAERVHPLSAERPVSHDYSHRAGVLGIAGAHPADGVRVVEVVVLIAEAVVAPGEKEVV